MDDRAPSDPAGEVRNPTGPKHRLASLLLLAIALASIALVQAVRLRTPPSTEERLRSDSDTALGALADKLAETPEDARTGLLLRYLNDPSPNLRYAAVDALGERKGGDVAEAIAAAFQDSASTVRQRAIEVLHRVAPERGYRLLLTALRDDDTWIREAAAMQLATILRRERLDTRLAYRSLVAALDVNDPFVTRTAVSTLSGLAGHPWRIRRGMTSAQIAAVVQRWNQWWSAEVRAGRVVSGELLEPVQPSRRDPGPSFRVRDIDGTTHTDAKLRGSIVLVHFYGTRCVPCDEEMRVLGRLYGDYARRGVVMLGVAMPPHDVEEVRRWCAARAITFPQALSTDRVVEEFGHIHAVPVSVLMDRQWTIRYRWEGERDAKVYRTALDRLLKE